MLGVCFVFNNFFYQLKIYLFTYNLLSLVNRYGKRKRATATAIGKYIFTFPVLVPLTVIVPFEYAKVIPFKVTE